MKLPLVWLKKYVPVSLSAETLGHKLTMSGTKVEEVHAAEGVIELEITTNRPDCLSILGLAHEVSALTEKKVIAPKVYSAKETAKKSVAEFDIRVEAKKACPLYTARLIRNVSIKPSDAETQKLLALAGTRAISNVVDATNFVLFESGQPLHAFDFDKVRGGKIVVRFSKKGEKFLAIDGTEHELDDQTLVIADVERPIALAGVMGGKLTEVTASTKNVLLESAYFDPATVRKASRKYKISSDSSYRFERGVDPAGVAPASRRAAELIGAWSGGQDATGLVAADFRDKKKPKPVTLRVARLEKLLGMPVPQAKVIRILKSLSIQAASQGKGKVRVQPDTFRRDIAQEVDVIEEVLRIEGFDKIPVIIPPTRHTLETPESWKASATLDLKKFLAALGFSEIITYSLVSAKLLKDAGLDPAAAHRALNTTGAGQEFFRPSLLPGMLEAAVFNLHRKAPGLKLFEIGNVYAGGRETTVLGLLICGLTENHWQKKTEASFHGLKGVLANVFAELRAGEASLIDVKAAGFGQAVEVRLAGEAAGRAGAISDAALKNFDVPRDVFYAEIVLDGILKGKTGAGRVKPVPKFPQVRRDLAFVLDESVRVADLEAAMKEAAAPFLREVALFDQYIGKNIAAGKRSLAFSLAYQKDTGTFTDDEITALQERVGGALKNRFAVEFR